MNNTSNFDMKAFKNLALKAIELHKKLSKKPSDIILLEELAVIYDEMGNTIGSNKYLALIKEQNPAYILKSDY
jgi:hypothetical protein